ncbi:hypothetical protein [Nocardioides solisilvae]|uniref:hypothetical protein n=1 Tax=Nocardioides solisilvae TaxID=1542435 RepID=UPI000D74F77B|nr:hypothetical protein [Nocardioides solisilvae]
MCRPTTCKTCGKTTWAGCGQHVGNVKASVPRDQWCDGQHTPTEQAAAKAARAGSGNGGFMSRIFGR